MSRSTYSRSFRRRVFTGNHLHCSTGTDKLSDNKRYRGENTPKNTKQTTSPYGQKNTKTLN